MPLTGGVAALRAFGSNSSTPERALCGGPAAKDMRPPHRASHVQPPPPGTCVSKSPITVLNCPPLRRSRAPSCGAHTPENASLEMAKPSGTSVQGCHCSKLQKCVSCAYPDFQKCLSNVWPSLFCFCSPTHGGGGLRAGPAPPPPLSGPPTHTNGEPRGTTDLSASGAWKIFLTSLGWGTGSTPHPPPPRFLHLPPLW